MIHLPAGFSALFKTKWDWGYQTTPQKQLGGRRADWPRMKALGGCSSMNAMIYIRGNRADYDEWRDAYGATGWGYDDVLPYFKKSEGNTRLDGEFHGTDGPLHVEDRRYTPRAEPRVRRVRGLGGLQAQRGLQRRRAGGRRALPGDLQEGSPLVGRGCLHPPGRQALQPDGADRGVRRPHRARGHARDRRDLPPRRRHPHGARQRRDRAVGGRDRQPADADAVRHRPGRAPARARHRRTRRPAGSRPEHAGPPDRRGAVLHQGHDRPRRVPQPRQRGQGAGGRARAPELQRRRGRRLLHLARRPHGARPAVPRARRPGSTTTVCTSPYAAG